VSTVPAAQTSISDATWWFRHC